MPAPCNLLRTPKINVDGIAAVLHVLGGGEQDLRIVSGKLDDEWSVLTRPVHVGEHGVSVQF